MLSCKETAHNNYSLGHGHNDLLKFQAADRILSVSFWCHLEKMFILYCVRIRLILSSSILIYSTICESTKLMNYQSAIFCHFLAHNHGGLGMENYTHYSANIHRESFKTL